MNYTKTELIADIKFLARRSMLAGTCSFTPERECGVSSNSIVAIAYGIEKLKDQNMPSDEWDLEACKNMWRKLPKHRKRTNACNAMAAAEAAIKLKKKR